MRSYETARKAGILFDFTEVIGLSSQEIASLGPADTMARSSICNKGLRWLQEAERLGGPSTHSRRLQFALRKHDRGPFANSSKSMLWERSEDRYAFIARFDPNCEWSATNSGDPEPINWSEADQAEANSAFVRWERENQTVLSSREQ